MLDELFFNISNILHVLRYVYERDRIAQTRFTVKLRKKRQTATTTAVAAGAATYSPTVFVLVLLLFIFLFCALSVCFLRYVEVNCGRYIYTSLSCEIANKQHAIQHNTF